MAADTIGITAHYRACDGVEPSDMVSKPIHTIGMVYRCISARRPQRNTRSVGICTKRRLFQRIYADECCLYRSFLYRRIP